jgi:beta-glucanase (GH16 family)
MESNIHYKNNKGEHKSITAKGEHKSFFNLPLQNEWNHFKCNWHEDRIEFYINGKLHRVVTDKKVLSKMNTEGMWAIFNIYPSDNFNYSVNGDIQKFGYSYRIRDFKVTRLK